MSIDIDDLPTLESDRLDAAQAAVETAKERLDSLREQQAEAEAEIERLTDEVDGLRLDVASGEATEEELSDAKASLKAAKERLSDLEDEIEEQTSTIPRLEDRVQAVREEVASDLAEDYAEAARSLLKQKARAMKQLATALEKAHALQEKASTNGLRRDDRIPSLRDTIRSRDGTRVSADRLRHLAGKIDDRLE